MTTPVPLPLSAAQHAVLLEGRERATDCVAQYLRADGPQPMRPAVLHEALVRAVRECEGLHVTFRWDADGPVQLPSPEPELAVNLLDLDFRTGPEAGEPAVEAWVEAELARPLDLGAGPAYRLALFRLPGGRIGWFQRYHRLVNDEAGMAVIAARVGEHYASLAEGGPALPAPGRSLTAWLAEEAAYRRSPQRAADHRYWRELLAGVPGPEPKSLAFPGSSVAQPVGCAGHHSLDGADPGNLARAARRSGGGPAAVLLAALAVYTHRLTGSRDLVLGHWTAAGTDTGTPGDAARPGTLLPIQLTVTPDLSFSTVAKRAGLALRRARRHRFLADADLPWSAPAGYDAIAAFELAPGPVHGSGCTVVRTWGAPGEGLFVRAQETADGGWRMGIRDSAAGPAAPDSRAAGHRLLRLVEQLVALPESPIGGFDLATEDELRRVGQELNATARSVPDSTITAEFAAVVRSTPQAVAVRGQGLELTYAELNERADRLAELLARRGTGPEDLVAVMLPRTPDMVVAVLAVLKSGAAYLPVDPEYPPGRIAFLLGDARPEAVLTRCDLAARLPTGAPPGVLLDAPATVAELAARPGNPYVRPDLVRPGNAAYVMYTSGSTGLPKGVVVTHRAVHNFARWSADELGPEAFSRVLGATSLSFDMSVFEILVPLLVGGSVDLVRNLLSLLQIPDWSGSLINTVPSVYRKVAGAEWVHERADHYVFCGEPLPAELVCEVQQKAPGATVHNIYGPTEVTVYATSWRCPPRTPEGDGNRPAVAPGAAAPPPIGTPVANVRCHVLDAALRPVPPGHTGELYLAGDYLARGYANRPGLTAERFLADPFDGPGARMYRTGDLARWTEAGALEFVSRTDNQVKVRGYRVELGEIEARLGALPQTAAAAVVATDDGEGDRRLTAYLVAADGHLPDPGAVRERLRADLPDPLVPAAIVFVDALPLNPNGKTDRPALQARAAQLSDADGPEPAEAPASVETLRGVFAQVLERAAVGPEDSFFAIGGDSVRSIKLVRRAREAGLVISPEDVFDRKTPAGLAEVAVRLRTLPPGSDAPARTAPAAGAATPSLGPATAPAARPAPASYEEPLVRLDAQERGWLAERHPALEDVLPLSPLQEGLLFHGQYDRQGEDAYVMQMTLDMTGHLDVHALRRACDLLCRRHPNLRAGFVQLPSGRAVQIVPERGPDVTEVDLTGLSECEQQAESDRIFAAGRVTRFDPADPPLIRFTLMRLAADRYRLLATAHHLLLDGWSNQLFLPELFALYSGPDGLPEPIPYRDYLGWLLRQDRDGSIQAWRDALGGGAQGGGVPEPTLLAPPGVHRTSMWPARLMHSMTREQSDVVTEFAGRQGVTVNTLMQCCWGLLLAEWTGRTDVLFGAIVSGRSPELPGVESMVGFLINTLPVRVRIAPGESLGDLLQRVQKEQVSLLAHHHIGLTEIQRAVGADELFDTAMVYENFPPAGDLRSALPGMEITGAASETAGHYPLSLMAIPRDGRLEFNFLYRPDVFGEDVIERMLGSLLRLVETFTTAPGTTLAGLDLLDADEHARLEAYRGGAPAMPQVTVTSLLDAQAARTPGAVALRQAGDEADPGAELSYAALHAWANQAARELIARGAGPEKRVAVLLTRSVGLTVSLLAVLKAGAAFVPLDPEYPCERLQLMLDDVRPTVVITDREHAATAPLHGRRDLLVLDDGRTAESIAGRSGTPLHDGLRRAPLLPAHPAYIVYTSGTSGRPKGVVVQHAGLAGVLHSTVPAIRAGLGSRILQFSSPCFDAGLYDFFEALTSGATLVVAPTDRLRPGRALEHLAHQEHITSICVPPSVLAVLTPGESLPPGTLIRCGGEALPADLAARWSALHPLVNAYGPTETTVAATITGALPGGGTGVPIGRPVAGTVIHLLDAALRPVGPGRPGELYVGGPAVTRGYLGQAASTADRFVADLFAGDGGRMYRTGDFARWNADGELEFIGRADRQIKIRGYRVEPGEIEAALERHPSIASAAVRPWTDDAGDTKLVAYVVPETRRAVVATGHDDRAGHAARAATESDLLQKWESLYTSLYSGQEEDVERVPFEADFTGWNSTYDGTPIPHKEMVEWRAATVRRILELQPSRVLEIGAGNGLILAEVAPHCESYLATDFSLPAVEALRRDLARSPGPTATAEVRQQAAHDFSGLAKGTFDTVILNSVVQYFPSRDYLLRVIEGALELLVPGGALFLGDIRDARLRGRLFTAAECAAAVPMTPVPAVRLAADRRALLDEELAVAPEFFTTLDAHGGPPVGGVDIRLKSGRRDNELTRYRYDVTLHNDAASAVSVRDAIRLRWHTDVSDLGELMTLLRSAAAPAPLRVCGIPDARLAIDMAVRRTLDAAPPATRIGALDLAPDAPGVHIEELTEWGVEFGYRVLATPSATEGAFDAVLVPGDAERFRDVYEAGPAAGPVAADLVHDPAAAATIAHLQGTLLDTLRSTLPGHALPSSVVVLPELPRTPNGKTDHATLPDPDLSVKAAGRGPRTVQERHLCALFAETLGLPSVGIDDNFFDLGGHSLLATRLARRLESTWGGKVDTSVVFVAPTVASLVEHIGVDDQELAFDTLLPLRPVHTAAASGAGGRLPLFCVHPAGGNGWMYSVLMRQLGTEQPLYALQCRGLDGTGQLPGTVEDMAADYITEIRSVQPEGPYHLLGWSFGGMVAHAMATCLQEQGQKVGLLAMLDSYVMVDVPELPPVQAFGGERAMYGALLEFAGIRPTVAGPGAWAGPDELSPERFLEIVRNGDSLLSGISEQHLIGMGNVYRNNVSLAVDFHPAKFSGDVLFFEARRDERTEHGAGERRDHSPVLDPGLWTPYVGRIRVHHSDFSHTDLGSPESLAEIGRTLAAELHPDERN
ncbi:amino acid adenylation domain-containing protein [Streptomyces sp. NPDC048637]|uniref:amino acid adenylation domain-containing protein n=1 Tax=Streptomyces sp. NPDC048637 TaxID=3155636 RepID=UPI0034167DB1